VPCSQHVARLHHSADVSHPKAISAPTQKRHRQAHLNRTEGPNLEGEKGAAARDEIVAGWKGAFRVGASSSSALHCVEPAPSNRAPVPRRRGSRAPPRRMRGSQAPPPMRAGRAAARGEGAPPRLTTIGFHDGCLGRSEHLQSYLKLSSKGILGRAG
jgi:hypothetical protein